MITVIYILKRITFSTESEGEFVKMVNILNEKQDFMWSLFGIRTTSEDTEEYWNE